MVEPREVLDGHPVDLFRNAMDPGRRRPLEGAGCAITRRGGLDGSSLLADILLPGSRSDSWAARDARATTPPPFRSLEQVEKAILIVLVRSETIELALELVGLGAVLFGLAEELLDARQVLGARARLVGRL